MKIELIKYESDDNRTFWKIINNGDFINVYASEQEGINGFDRYVARLQQPEPKPQPEIIKSVTI